VYFAGFAFHGDGDGAATHRAIFNMFVRSLRCVDGRREDLAAPRAVYGGVLNVVHDLEVCLGLEPLFQFEPSLVQLFLPTLQVAHFTLGVGKVSQGFRSAAVPS